MQRANNTVDLTSYEARRSASDELMTVTETLIADFAERLPAGTVIRHLALAREQLLAEGVRSGIAVAAEALARLRLTALVPPHSVSA